MPSQVSICNQALSKLGANRIISIDQDSTEAKLCKLYYQDILDDLLEEHPWTFALKRYELPQMAESPPKPFVAQFLIPSDVLRIVKASSNPDFRKQNTTEWQVENGHILADTESIYIQAIITLVDPNVFSLKFTRAFVTRLAAEMSINITQSREMHRQLMDEFGLLLDSAVSADSQQGRTRKYHSDQLLNVRTTGTSFAGPEV